MDFKRLIISVGDFLRRFFGDASEILESKAPVAVRVVGYLKDGIEKHDATIQALLDRTATEKDNEAYDFIKDNLPALVKELALIDGLADEFDSTGTAWKKYTSYLSRKAKGARAKDWIYLAGQVLSWILLKKVPIQAAIIATQKAFQLIFGKKN